MMHGGLYDWVALETEDLTLRKRGKEREGGGLQVAFHNPLQVI